jgi:hypothetical protein
VQRGIDGDVLPGETLERIRVLDDPDRLAVLADEHHPLRRPFGMSNAGAATEAFLNARFLPWLDMGGTAAFVTDPSGQRRGVCGRGKPRQKEREKNNLSFHLESSRNPILLLRWNARRHSLAARRRMRAYGQVVETILTALARM